MKSTSNTILFDGRSFRRRLFRPIHFVTDHFVADHFIANHFVADHFVEYHFVDDHFDLIISSQINSSRSFRRNIFGYLYERSQRNLLHGLLTVAELDVFTH